ncbi:hypothetical protein DPMN_175032 [Dreissena polymorpha]|uniref:Uncharacterized protein n=1 Tax=Dreissena polymorpha TaxID=45954 RepID=A0A9D4E4E7_DREPO|nr:hypothetical protein DPMN_175032 [Dreissena polymorpha]
MYSSELQTANTEESVLCMTDMSTDMSIMQHPAYSSTVATSGHNECDSDTADICQRHHWIQQEKKGD